MTVDQINRAISALDRGAFKNTGLNAAAAEDVRERLLIELVARFLP